MKRPSAPALLVVLLLAACQAKPTPTPAPPQAEPTQVQQPQEQPASASALPKLLDQALGQKLQALEAAVASPDTKWPGAVLCVCPVPTPGAAPPASLAWLAPRQDHAARLHLP